MAPAGMLEAERLRMPWSGAPLAFGAIDLDAADAPDALIHVPPFPLIGIGRPIGALAAAMDTIVDPPCSIGSVIDGLSQSPAAAAVAVQLLRLIERLPVAEALVAESIAYGLLQGSAEHSGWLARHRGGDINAPGDVLMTRSGATLELVIDRPDARNAIDTALRDRLREAFELAAIDSGIERVLLTARGRTFSIGADLGEFGTTRDPATAHAIRQATLPATAIAAAAAKLEVRVDGACIGAGLEMAAFARRIVATRRAWFQLPELTMGLIPGAGGCVSVARRIGRQRTALMLLSGRRIDAATALRWGLVDALVDDLASDPGSAHVFGA